MITLSFFWFLIVFVILFVLLHLYLFIRIQKCRFILKNAKNYDEIESAKKKMSFSRATIHTFSNKTQSHFRAYKLAEGIEMTHQGKYDINNFTIFIQRG